MKKLGYNHTQKTMLFKTEKPKLRSAKANTVKLTTSRASAMLNNLVCKVLQTQLDHTIIALCVI